MMASSSEVGGIVVAVARVAVARRLSFCEFVYGAFDEQVRNSPTRVLNVVGRILRLANPMYFAIELLPTRFGPYK
jgi:hypothetical protein